VFGKTPLKVQNNYMF